MTEKLREYFDDMVVFKDLKNNSVFSSLGLPSFTRDWLLRKFEDDEGNFDIEELSLSFMSLRFLSAFTDSSKVGISPA